MFGSWRRSARSSGHSQMYGTNIFSLPMGKNLGRKIPQNCGLEQVTHKPFFLVSRSLRAGTTVYRRRSWHSIFSLCLKTKVTWHDRCKATAVISAIGKRTVFFSSCCPLLPRRAHFGVTFCALLLGRRNVEHVIGPVLIFNLSPYFTRTCIVLL
jgi:hypothetical protein